MDTPLEQPKSCRRRQQVGKQVTFTGPLVQTTDDNGRQRWGGWRRSLQAWDITAFLGPERVVLKPVDHFGADTAACILS